MPSGTKFGFGDSSFPVLTWTGTTAVWTSSELGKTTETWSQCAAVLVPLAKMMSSFSAFFSGEYTLFLTNSLFPSLCNRQLLDTSFYLTQTNFSLLCLHYQFKHCHSTVNFWQHHRSCTNVEFMSRMYKSGNLLHFLSWEESLGAETSAVGELPIFISLELLLWEQGFREITLSNRDFLITLCMLRKVTSV